MVTSTFEPHEVRTDLSDSIEGDRVLLVIGSGDRCIVHELTANEIRRKRIVDLNVKFRKAVGRVA